MTIGREGFQPIDFALACPETWRSTISLSMPLVNCLTIDEKRRLFYEACAATISPENWREMDREDILPLALPGDELYSVWEL